MFYVDEVRPGLPSNFRRLDVVGYQLLDLRVSPHLVVAGHVEFAIQNWMPVGHSGLHPELVGGLAEAPRMCELKANYQVIDSPKTFLMGGNQRFTQPDQRLFILLVYNELIGIGASVRTHCHRL